MNKYGEPWRFGKTGPEQMMLLNKNGKYAASIQIYQTPRHYGEIDEERRAASAKRIISCVNALAGIEDPEAFVQRAKKLIDDEQFMTELCS